MAKRSKLRIFTILSCRSEDSAATTHSVTPIPIFRKPNNTTTTTTTTTTTRDFVLPTIPPSIKRRVSSSSTVSTGCGWRTKPKKQYIRYYSNIQSTPSATPRRRKIYNNSSSSPTSDSDDYVSASPTFQKKGKKLNQKKTRFSNSSSINTTVWFSSEEEVDSSSFSDSGTQLDPINETPISGVIVQKKNKKKRRSHHGKVKKVKYYGSKSRVTPISKKVTCNSPETESSLEMKKSLAVMKKSEDPYGDFKRSMMEMILEKEMFETKDLEHLLQCFLALNSRNHYGVIIEAFSDIWEILFSKTSTM